MFICPISESLKVLKGKWRVTILFLLEHQPKRYNVLKFECKGITNTMLNRSLKELEKYDYIERKDYSSDILHVEYSLTQKGKETLKSLKDLNQIDTQMSKKHR